MVPRCWPSSFGTPMTHASKIILVMAATAVCGLAIPSWALRPLGFHSYLSSANASDAEIIRQYWPDRLVPPDWVSSVPDRMMNWMFAPIDIPVASP